MKCATQHAASLFPDAELPSAGWLAKWVRFRAAYPAKKRNTKPERGKEAMQRLFQGMGGEAADALFGRMLAALEAHKRSERWEDPAFIPHMASWINGRYWEHDLAEYRPRPQVKSDRCPECGLSWRVHKNFGSHPDQQPNAQGVFCP